MATYQSIITGYKPEGALGGLYAGENAAMARQQTESANLADLFDAYQKQAAVQQAQFNLGESQYKAGSERAVSDLAKATAIGQNNPAYLAAIRGGQLGQAQSLTAAGSRDTALLPSSIEAGKAKNMGEVASAGFTEAAKQVDTIAGLAQQSPLMAASYINQNITNPEKRGEYLRLLQAGQIPALQQQFALQSQAHMAEMDKVNTEIAGRSNAAAITAQSYNYAADKNAETALLQQDKLKLDFLQSQAQRSADLAKQLQSNLTSNNAWLTPKGRETPQYKAALKAADDAQRDATESLTQLREFAQQPRKGKGVPESTATTPVVPVEPSGSVAGSFVRDPKTGKLVLQQ